MRFKDKEQISIDLIEPNYNDIAKVLSEFEKLYKVCDNKKMLDQCIERLFSPSIITKNNEP